MPTSTTLDFASIPPSGKNLPPPPGFTTKPSKGTSSSSTSRISSSYESLKSRRAWELAISPAKSLPMQAFMLYMSGSGVQIFSIGIVFMLLSSPWKSLSNTNKVFAPFAPADATSPTALSTLLPVKIVYLLCNLLTFALGLYKCRQMGLLPTGTGDWLAFETRGQAPELTLL